MISKEVVEKLIDQYLKDNDLFLVEISVSSDNDIGIAIESSDVVHINNCADISKIVEAGLNRDAEDFSLTVTSAGLDQPFKVFKQYLRFIGKEVVVLLRNGTKMIGTLTDAQEDKIELCFSKLEKTEGKKKRERIDVRQYYSMSEIKSTKPFINFK
jgi:ribosome maturation factor RimP